MARKSNLDAIQFHVLRWDGALIARSPRKTDAMYIAKDSAKKYGQSYIHVRKYDRIIGSYHIVKHGKGTSTHIQGDVEGKTGMMFNTPTGFVAYVGDHTIDVGPILDKAFKLAKEHSKRSGESYLYDVNKGKMIAHFVHGIRTQEGEQTRTSKGVRYTPKGPKVLHNPRGTLIYGKVNRIIATKVQQHICDAECKRHGHRYFHDFTSSAKMYGLPNGDLLITSR